MSITTPEPGGSAPAAVNDDLSDAIFISQNNIRTDPTSFLALLNTYKAGFDGLEVTIDGVTTTTIEGVAAVDEAIAFLNAQSALSALTRSSGMNLASADHVAD